MSVKTRAIEAISTLPDDADFDQVIREVALMGGVERAIAEIDRGEGMTADQARDALAEWVSK